MNQVIVLTLWNKPEYIQEAINSVKAQTRECLHICVKDEGQFVGRYPPAVFYNEQCRQAPYNAYLSWLSDDDILLPTYAEYLAGLLDAHSEYDCVWGGSRHIIHNPPQVDREVRSLPPDGNFNQVFYDDNLPIFKIDGGQYMIRRTALDKIEYPYASEEINEETRRADGVLMNKIARAVKIYPLSKVVMISRTTPKSSHVRIVDGKLKAMDWRSQAVQHTIQL